mmetsp:Transcript_32677/g.79414  ORF Transcript_32677/g.79414 Transcript_32677/m.79414 type:complete len:346 (-) Transcript_32677:157-1194(-)
MSAAVASKQIPVVCPGHTRPLAELQYIHVTNEEAKEDRTFLLSACHDRQPMLRDGVTGDWIGTWSGHKGAVWSLQMDPTGSLAATASGDFSARLWDAVTGNSLLELPHSHIVKTCAFSSNSEKLATGGKEALLRVYDLPKILLGKKKGGKDNNNNKVPTALEIKQDAPITKLAWLTDDLLVSACSNGKMYLWDVSPSSGTPPTKPLYVFDTNSTAEIRDMEIRIIESGQTILTAAAGQKVYFFDATPSTPSNYSLLKEWPMPIHFKEEGGATLHPSGTKFVAGGSDLWVRVFDYATGEELECNKGHHGPIRCVRYSPDGKLYASGSEDGTIRLWKTDPSADGPEA